MPVLWINERGVLTMPKRFRGNGEAFVRDEQEGLAREASVTLAAVTAVEHETHLIGTSSQRPRNLLYPSVLGAPVESIRVLILQQAG